MVTEEDFSSEGMPEEENSQSEGVRRSTRQIKPPKKFHYPNLGNPLISVVQSLLQGLSTAFAQSEENSELFWNKCVMVLGDLLSVLTTQPYACSRTCIRSKGEGVTFLFNLSFIFMSIGTSNWIILCLWEPTNEDQGCCVAHFFVFLNSHAAGARALSLIGWSEEQTWFESLHRK